MRLLLESGHAFPPILVHRESMRVIDGMHRLQAATERGEDTISVRFFEGSSDEVFLAAVQANTTHGLPLSLSDRKFAATRILETHAHWSDRAIAKVVGLAHDTVGRLRARASGETDQLHDARLGRDGRMRSPDISQGRALARELLTTKPGSSLREVAKASGISVGTVRSIRKLMQAEVAEASATSSEAPQVIPITRQQDADPSGTLKRLLSDPSLRFSESGRSLLRWLNAKAVDPDDGKELVQGIPAHCVPIIAHLAKSYASTWEQFASELTAESDQRAL